MKSNATHHRIHQIKITHQNFRSNNNNNEILCFCLKFKKEKKNTPTETAIFAERKEKTKSYLKKG